MPKVCSYSDGGSRGNPGKSAYAIVITVDGKVVHEHAEFLGVHTNNYAEYRGLIAGISKCLELGFDDVEFVMDSQLVIRQITSENADFLNSSNPNYSRYLIQFAVIIAAIAPIIIVFPFFQDKMEKGVLQGGVKG